ncbi:mitochondrial fission process protein 1-like [Tubulanus polymorphus]|uniref:mitochondrial fission process protein 1-like n=1 Tax=Tubulanus polymorphus TaxID=672921 RepID=UPI003DA28B57
MTEKTSGILPSKVEMISVESSHKECHDVFKHTPVRYLGYANEVGEAFRALIPLAAVRASYAVASGYVVADSAHKGYHAAQEDWPSNQIRTRKIVRAVGDTMMWQGLASVIIPGFTINRICAFSLFVFRKTKILPAAAQKWTTTAIGLGSIPFIIKPIDRSVDYIMNETIRKLYKPKLGKDEEGLVHHTRND